MTDPYPIGDVVVTGQRARGPSPFAELTFPTKGNWSGEESEQAPDGPGGGGGGTLSDEAQQCSDPEGRRQWNADAAAQAAIAAFFLKASDLGDPDLQNREFGALLCDTGNGNVVLGPIASGPPIMGGDGQPIEYPGGRASVDIPTGGCSGARVVGFVHSHPGTNVGIPSDPDFGYAQWHVDYNNAPASMGIYVAAQYQNSQTGSYQTAVSRAGLDDREAASQGTWEPEWINPEAQPCPGAG